MKKSVDVAVLGASGYMGIELLQRLAGHPGVNLKFISSESKAGFYPGHLFPPLRRHEVFKELRYRKVEELEEVDLAMAALPTGVLPRIISKVLEKAKCVINIAGDFRLDDDIKKYYPSSIDVQHALSKTYVVPEFHDNYQYEVLNMPGCMAVAVIYALYPLAKNNLLGSEVIIDAKTGSSGGGSGKGEVHAIRSNNMKTHKLLGHRHAAEVKNYLRRMSPQLKDVYMTTTSVDMPRGIMVHVHGNIKLKVTINQLHRVYRNTYKDSPFVRVVSLNKGSEALPSVKGVVGTNDCEVGFAINESGRHFVATATLDNMVKGGPGNAIQALNNKYGYDISWGLSGYGVWP